MLANLTIYLEISRIYSIHTEHVSKLTMYKHKKNIKKTTYVVTSYSARLIFLAVFYLFIKKLEKEMKQVQELEND